MAPAAIVYLAVNEVNGKRYVGVTRFAVEHRWRQHVDRARAGIKTRLGAALRKYGAEHFIVHVVASCLSIEAASEVERAVIKQVAPEYNQTNGGEITAGRRVPPDVVAKVAAANRGKKRSAEANAKNSAQAKKRWRDNPEWRQAVMAAAAKGRANCDQSKRIAAVRAANTGRRMSDDAREKIRQAAVGRRHSAEVINRIAAAKTKPVLCTTTGQVFSGTKEDAEITGASRHGIYHVLHGRHQYTSGLNFKYYEGVV